MGDKTKDLTGKRFGRYTVIERAPTPKGTRQKQARWLCRCDCGTLRIRKGNELRLGKGKSCGCLNREITAARNFRHGLKGTREHNSWAAAKQRCYYTKGRAYKNYGERGISMCDGWKNDFNKFLADMGSCPQGHTLERINPEGNYEPDNCKWATRKEQKENQRRSKYVFFEGRKWNLKRLAEHLGLNYNRLKRLCFTYKLSLEDALNGY